MIVNVHIFFVYDSTWWYMMVHDGTWCYMMVHDATCISCQITSQHISTPRVLFSNKTPKKFAAVRCSFSSCRNFWAESGFAVATRYAGGFQVSKKSTSSMATASTTGIGRMGISKYVKHISNMSTYEGSQHSTYVKYEGSQRRCKTFWLLWWQAKPFWELPEFWAVNTFQTGNAHDQINTDFISAPLPKSWRWGMPTQIPCWELLEINQKKAGRRERQEFVHEKKVGNVPNIPCILVNHHTWVCRQIGAP